MIARPEQRRRKPQVTPATRRDARHPRHVEPAGEDDVQSEDPSQTPRGAASPLTNGRPPYGGHHYSYIPLARNPAPTVASHNADPGQILRTVDTITRCHTARRVLPHGDTPGASAMPANCDVPPTTPGRWCPRAHRRPIGTSPGPGISPERPQSAVPNDPRPAGPLPSRVVAPPAGPATRSQAAMFANRRSEIVGKPDSGPARRRVNRGQSRQKCCAEYPWDKRPRRQT